MNRRGKAEGRRHSMFLGEERRTSHDASSSTSTARWFGSIVCATSDWNFGSHNISIDMDMDIILPSEHDRDA